MTDRESERERVFLGTGLFWGFIVLLLLALAIIILAAQNTGSVDLRWLNLEFETPLFVVILVTAVVTVVLDELVGLLWRRRRRRILSEREELQRLRAREAATAPAGAERPDSEEGPGPSREQRAEQPPEDRHA